MSTMTAPAPQTPKPHNQSHDCQKHAVLQSLLPDNQTAKHQTQPDWQPDFMLSFSWASASQPTVTRGNPPLTPFKPPPRQQHSTVQRI